MYIFVGKHNNIYQTDFKTNSKCKRGTVDDSNKCSLEENNDDTNINFNNLILPLNDKSYPDAPFRSQSRAKLDESSRINIENVPRQYTKILFNNINTINNESDRLKIPKLRGVVSEKESSVGMASMMDGILAVTPETFRDNPESEVKLLISRNEKHLEELESWLRKDEKTISDQKTNWEKFNKNLVQSGITFEESTLYKFGNTIVDRLKTSKEQIELTKARLNELKTSGISALKNSWESGDDLSKRPFGVDEFFDFNKRTELILQHEFAHHIHQQYKTTKSNYNNPPMEKDIEKIHAKCTKDKSLISASKYGDSDPQEWFAESYVLYKNDRHDLVTPALLDYFRKKNL